LSEHKTSTLGLHQYDNECRCKSISKIVNVQTDPEKHIRTYVDTLAFTSNKKGNLKHEPTHTS